METIQEKIENHDCHLSADSGCQCVKWREELEKELADTDICPECEGTGITYVGEYDDRRERKCYCQATENDLYDEWRDNQE